MLLSSWVVSIVLAAHRRLQRSRSCAARYHPPTGLTRDTSCFTTIAARFYTLADVHSKGLKIGLYTAMGKQTCAMSHLFPAGDVGLGCDFDALPGGCTRAKQDIEDFVAWVSHAWMGESCVVGRSQRGNITVPTVVAGQVKHTRTTVEQQPGPMHGLVVCRISLSLPATPPPPHTHTHTPYMTHPLSLSLSFSLFLSLSLSPMSPPFCLILPPPPASSL